MTRKYTKEFFEDREKISRYEQRLLSMIGPNEFYHIIILALVNVLVTIIHHWVIDGEVMTRWHGGEK